MPDCYAPCWSLAELPRVSCSALLRIFPASAQIVVFSPGGACNPSGSTMVPAFDLEAIDAALEAQSNLAAGPTEPRAAPESVRIPGSCASVDRLVMWIMPECVRVLAGRVGAGRVYTCQ